MTDLAAAAAFLTTHGRVLDRRRLDLIFGSGTPDGVLTALAAHRNPDGGFGWGLESDLRSPASQPVCALHALEILDEVSAPTGMAVDLCGWLESATLADGGLPFAGVEADGPGSAPWWAAADPLASSLHMTSAITGQALRLARHDPAVASHPWLERATDHCWRTITALEEPPGAYELVYILRFLDAITPSRPEAAGMLERLTETLSPDWEQAVEGGVEGEKLRPLDFSPWPSGPLRELVPEPVIEADLDRLEGGQRHDGGWTVDFVSFSPAASLEWRGHATVGALTLLRAHGRRPGPVN